MITVQKLEWLLLETPNTWAQDAILKARQQIECHKKNCLFYQWRE